MTVMRALVAVLLFAGCSPSVARSPGSAALDLADATMNVEVESGGSPVSLGAFGTAVDQAGVVCLGEAHDAAAHHHLHARLVERWARPAERGSFELAVGFEMFEGPFQPALDAYASGSSTFAALLDATDWRHRWGWEPAPYQPIVEAARAGRAVLLALNARRELTRLVARSGLESVPLALREELPEVDLGDAEHRRFFAASMAGHGPIGFSENFYAAQVLWDESMAARAAKWLLDKRGPARRLVILAGNGHCHESAIPRRLRRRLVRAGASGLRVVSVLTRTRGGELPPFAASDYVLTVDEERMAKKKKDDTPPVERYGDGIIARNRRAAFDFELSDTYEAGIQLVGSEVKVLRSGKADLSEAYVTIERGEAFLHAANIPERSASLFGHTAKRKRKLLLNRDEIDAIERSTEREGMTVVATKIYFRGGRAKVEIALARGKKQFDKRETLKRKEADREARAAIAGRRGG